MIKYIFIFLIIVILLYFYTNKIQIKFSSFLRRSFRRKTNKFGVYCYCGKQGQGKTYSVIEFLLSNKDKKIFSNVKSLTGVNYTYISSFDELLSLKNEKDCIIFYDEIFTALTKSSRMTTEVLGFLSQMRKRNIIFLTTCQEWLELNITLRRYCRFQIDCSMRSIFDIPFLIKKFYDADNMKWDNLENEYIAPIIKTTISKGNKYVIESYNTFETIESSNN